MKNQINWENAFLKPKSWPTRSLSVQNTKPPGGRNIFADERHAILKAAQHHGYRIVSPPNAKVVSFVCHP